jgi:hypothetical protein
LLNPANDAAASSLAALSATNNVFGSNKSEWAEIFAPVPPDLEADVDGAIAGMRCGWLFFGWCVGETEDEMAKRLRKGKTRGFFVNRFSFE